MKKLINVTFVLLLLCSAVTLVSCGKDDDKGSGKEYPEGTRELTQNGITARIDQERWGGDGGNTVLYVNIKLTKKDKFETKPTGKVYIQARTTDGEVLYSAQGKSKDFGNLWNADVHYLEFSFFLVNGKKLKANSLTISKIEVN